MKKVIWMNENDEVLFQENASILDLPRIGESVIWHRLYLNVKNIEHNYDEKHITVFVEVQ